MYSTKISPEELARMIDHTNLKPFSTKKEISKLCDEAIKFNFAAVCVNSSFISYCKVLLKKSDIGLASVVGFPLGACSTKTKAIETTEAVNNGANEIDMVMNVGSLREGNYSAVEQDISKVVKAADGACVKVILETGFLTDDQIIEACKISKNAGAHFVKTSTGFGPMGAFYDHIVLMRQTVGPEFGVKASGGIRDARTAVRLVNAGANRLGASAGVVIVRNLATVIDEGTWYLSDGDNPESLYSCSAADPKKQPKDVYDFYMQKRKQFKKG